MNLERGPSSDDSRRYRSGPIGRNTPRCEHGFDGQVTRLTFPKFVSRPSENEGRGTDHGTVTPLFVRGSRVKRASTACSPCLNLE